MRQTEKIIVRVCESNNNKHAVQNVYNNSWDQWSESKSRQKAGHKKHSTTKEKSPSATYTTSRTYQHTQPTTSAPRYGLAFLALHLYTHHTHNSRKPTLSNPSTGTPEVQEVEALEHELEHGGQVLRRWCRDENVAVPVRDRTGEAQPYRRRLSSSSAARKQ